MVRVVVAVMSMLVCGPVHALSWDGGTLEQALAKARTNDRWVLVDLSASWCAPCHELDEKVFPREDVSTAVTTAFVPLKRDGELGEGEAIVKRYHVVGFPTLLVLDATGAEVDRLMGFVQPEQLIASLRDLRAGKGTLTALEKKLEAAPADEALRLEVGTRHAMRGDPRAVAELTQVAKFDPDNQARRAAVALLTLGKYYYLRGAKDYPHAEATLRELDKRFPASEPAGQVGYNLGLALHFQGRDAEARAVLDRWVSSTDTSRFNAYAWLCLKNNFERAHGIEVARAGLLLDDKDHALWDTLAELLAATGKLAEARDAEHKALGIKPGDTYYEAQLRRFGGGK